MLDSLTPKFDTLERQRESEINAMLNSKLNNGAISSIPENAEKVKTFEHLKRDFETAYASGNDYAPQLLDLSTAIARSVVRKCLDPQRKTAAEHDVVSNNGFNPAMDELRRGITTDIQLFDMTADAADKAIKATLNVNGDPVTVTADKAAESALNALIGRTLSDGIDLVQEAACTLLEQAADHADSPGWLDRPYTVRRLSRRVYIRAEDSAAYADVQTAPMREVYRAVRRAVQDSRATQTDPRNGYTYIEDMTGDGLETIYYRLRKHADLGGYAVSGDYSNTAGAPAGLSTRGTGGGYTASIQTVKAYYGIIDRLNLTPRQREIVELRMQGKGMRQIATYLGVQPETINKTLARLRDRCEKIGFTPEMWDEMTEDAE